MDAWTIATNLAVAGIPVFPCGENKQPLTPHGFKDASTDLEQIDRWCEQYPDALIAVPTGRASRIFVVDIDPDGADWYTDKSTDLVCGRIHKTRRGWHLLYRWPDRAAIRNSASKIAQGVDVRGEGGYIIWWPAHGLEIVGDLENIGPAPAWLVDLLSKQPPQAAPGITAGQIVEGGRNDFLSREAFRLRKRGANSKQILADITELNRTKCRPPLDATELEGIAAGKMIVEPEVTSTLSLDNFYAYMPMHQYIFVPSREMWPSSSVNARLQPPVGAAEKTASAWLDAHQPVDQMTWAPGEPLLIRDRLISNGGWSQNAGSSCFNLYQPPQIELGDATKAGPWLDHVERVYPENCGHIIAWMAQRVQRPDQKINHALVLGGAPGVGKDTLVEPLKAAVGPWNFAEVSPVTMLGRFNGFVKSVVLRISEARDLGDVDRYAFYDHMKVYTAAPPDVLRCDEKHIREHAVLNCCGVIITTNHKTDGIYLPADDRRNYVAWSDLTKEDFTETYWDDLWQWYADGGLGHVAAYLATLDISGFNPKAPPPKTAAFYDIVDANRAPEDAELADILDAAHNPPAITLTRLIDYARLAGRNTFAEWLEDRKNRRNIPHRLEEAGYLPVRNDTAQDGLWRVGGRRQAAYAIKTLSLNERLQAVGRLER